MTMKTVFNAPIYNNFVNDYGMKNVIPCHALCFYAHNLGLLLENLEVHIEGEKVAPLEPKAFLLSTAKLYATSPDYMLQFWPEIDRVFDLFGWKRIPNEYKYRFVSVLVNQQGKVIKFGRE
jgi:hypothetical protein